MKIPIGIFIQAPGAKQTLIYEFFHPRWGSMDCMIRHHRDWFMDPGSEVSPLEINIDDWEIFLKNLHSGDWDWMVLSEEIEVLTSDNCPSPITATTSTNMISNVPKNDLPDCITLENIDLQDDYLPMYINLPFKV